MAIAQRFIAFVLFSLAIHIQAQENPKPMETERMKTALLIVDPQINMWKGKFPLHNGMQLLDKLGVLISDARRAGILVVYIQNNGGPGDPDEPETEGWEIHPKLAPAEGDIVIQKDKPSAFENTGLLQVLRGKGIENLIVAGLQTEMCVQANCLSAVKHEYDVILVEDAHSTFDGDSETAEQMIRRHNKELGHLLTLRKLKDLPFVSPEDR